MPENNTITEEQIEDVYQKLMKYCNYQLSVFETQIQSHIVEAVKNIILNEGIYNWNQTSLIDYINNIIYIIKGQQFSRTINSFAEEFIVNKLREDFGDEIYNNAKNALNLHKIYYKKITVKRKLKKIIANFKAKWDTTNELWKNNFFEGLTSYKDLKINVSFGMENRLVLPKTPYMNFLKGDFTTNKGVYPYVTYLYHENKFELGISISRDNEPDVNNLILTKIKSYSKTYLDTDDLDSVIEQLDICIDDFLNILASNDNSKPNPKEIQMKTKNIILYGAPGVGKTHNTNKLISLIDEGKRSERDVFNNIKENKNETITLNDDLKSRVKFITFHQSFGYEDFIEGFRPNNEGNIKIEKGIFHNICIEAIKEENKDKNYYLVIDEINRGNISKIFGELITLIEEDKRDQIEVTLPYSKETFKVPSNLFIIGTMNSADKSIALIDIALRRRFTFLKMSPNETLVPQIARQIFNDLNKSISEIIGEDYQIGHSYFMNIANDDDLQFVLDYKIRLLLEEYYYGNSNGLKDVLDICSR